MRPVTVVLLCVLAALTGFLGRNTLQARLPSTVVVKTSREASSNPYPVRHVPTNKVGEYYTALSPAADGLPCWGRRAQMPFCCICFDTNLDGRFYSDNDGELWFEPSSISPSCRLRRLGAPESRSLLNGKTVTFMGDSLTRYAYLNLAAFLVSGRLIERYAGVPNTEPSLNMQFQFKPEFAGDTEDTNTLLYRAFARVVETSSHGLNSSQTCSSKYDLCGVNVQLPDGGSFSLDFVPLYGLGQGAANITAAIHAAIEKGADVLIVNHGAWSGPDLVANDTAVWKQVFEATRQLKQQKGYMTQLVWRTTYHTRDFEQWRTDLNAQLVSGARQHGWHVLDLRKITGAGLAAALPFHWDNLHLLPFMNDQMNDVILNLLHSLWRGNCGCLHVHRNQTKKE